MGISTDIDDSASHPLQHRVTALEMRIDTILPTLATKADIGEIKAALGAAIGDNKAAIAEAKSAIITWLTASLMAVVAIFLSSLFFVANRLAAPAASLAPVPGAMTPAATPPPPNNPVMPGLR